MNKISINDLNIQLYFDPFIINNMGYENTHRHFSQYLVTP